MSTRKRTSGVAPESGRSRCDECTLQKAPGYNTRSWASVKKAGHGGYMGDGEDAARARYFAAAGDFEPE